MSDDERKRAMDQLHRERECVDRLARSINTAMGKYEYEMGPLGWRDVDPSFLLIRLMEEAGTLAQAMLDLARERQAEDVIAQCAEVGAFAAMLADLYWALSGEAELDLPGPTAEVPDLIELDEEMRRIAGESWYSGLMDVDPAQGREEPDGEEGTGTA